MDVTSCPVVCRWACSVGMNCLNFAAAAFPSTIKHQVVPSMGPAVIAWRKLVGIKNWMICNHTIDWDNDISSNAGKSTLEFNVIVTQLETTGSVKTDIQDNFFVLDMFLGYLRGLIDLHGDVRRQAIIRTPFMQRTNEVRPCGGRFERTDHVLNLIKRVYSH